MSTAEDLHAACVAAVHARLETARAATPGPWAPDAPWLSDVVNSALLGPVADCSIGTVFRPQSLEDAKHIAANDPAAIIAGCEADLERLEEHRPCDFRKAYGPHPEHFCHGCGEPTPGGCVEVRRIARANRVEVATDG